MAASVARSQLTPLSRQITAKPSQSDQTPKCIVRFRPLNIPRRFNVTVKASINRNDEKIGGNNNKTAPALHPQSILDDDDDEEDAASKDSLNSLPRPLSSAQFSNFVSDGSRLRVAYQGVRGAYSESAAEKAYPNCEAVPCEQFDTAFEAVERWLVDRAVLPIENSLGGSIHRNYDLLLRHRLHIVGEVKFAVRHCLLANPGVKVEDLKRVLSHPQALAQCENTLTKLGLVREAVDDTAGAAKQLKDTGAVASSSAAAIYGLNILAEDIQTSIVFSLEEGPGVLFKALAVFALRQINLTKHFYVFLNQIESRPLRNQPLRSSDDNSGFGKYFDYLFYVDFEASMADQKAQNALRHLKEFATFLRVLGSYPIDTTIVP
ncbi:Arogenate dehydratase/prephenate dehydratase 2 [Citrus sinensis]|uniref:Arogenate dehydratase/prephenate dehydratase 2 n=1 Tax=Citrus sinensis TaxID=2711 RepID=A0ACB8IUV3_CITSI|nr:Arogenate dehydratase/prephenate dehydratase 2 [Citrus sinensis]